jgi:hypothetical protein
LHYCCNSLWARPTTANEARKIITVWLKAELCPLGAALGSRIGKVETFTDGSGEPIYYCVYLQPSGFVIVSADDTVEPIIAFSDKTTYDPSPANPLGALVGQDLKERVQAARNPNQIRVKPQKLTAADHQHKWNKLTTDAETSDDRLSFFGITTISEVLVPPLLQSKWSQSSVCGNTCYNYYTPDNYRCGCVATAMAQLMRYHQHPANGIGVQGFWIRKDDGEPFAAYTRGGDGAGGPYHWSDMVFVSDCDTSLTQREAIGALCYDAAISIGTNFTGTSAEADTLKAKDALINTFQYGSAVKSYNSGASIGAALMNMINPNLDAKDPVIIGITGSSSHSVLCDGYGYNFSTLYHHLNMGWSGTYNAWYNLPNIDSVPAYTTIYKCIYNIHITDEGSGEVVSGRIFDHRGNPIANASIYATLNGSGDYTTTTSSDSSGIYAFDNLASNSTYTISALVTGYVFNSQNVTTGMSTDGTAICGNVWGIYFYGKLLEIKTITPNSGPAGSYIKIEGQNFGSSPGIVIFAGGKTGEELQWSDTTVYCRVPKGASSGLVQIYTAEYAATKGMYFGVTDPATLIVDINKCKPDTENGTATYPFGKIQRGISAATEGDTVIIKPGTYAENIRFNGINITLTGIAPSDPSVTASTIIDGNQIGPVVTFESGEGSDCKLLGFTITNGKSSSGGGIYCSQSSPTISYCTVRNNSAISSGGGMYNYESSPTLISCTFSENSAASGAGISSQSSNTKLDNCIFSGNYAKLQGGGMNNNLATPLLKNCTFRDNYADKGGGMASSNGDSKLVDCIFTANSAGTKGGGMYNNASVATLANCIFIANISADDGGGIYNMGLASTTITNCTFSANSAADRAGGIYDYTSNPIISNCILWGNSCKTGSDQVGQIDSGTPSVNYCCIKGWTGSLGGIANTGSDPNFVRNPDDGGDVWGTGENDDFGDLRLLSVSPCIDAGNNSAISTDFFDLDNDGNTVELTPWDIGGHPRRLDAPLKTDTGNGTRPIVDMGAYEFGTLIAHWKLDETAGATAKDSVATNHGTLYGGATWQPTSGMLDGALSFNGSTAYIRTANESYFDLTDAITVATWVKINAVTKDWQAIITKGDSAWRLSTVNKEPRIHFAVTNSPANYVNSDTLLQIGEWHHVCGTYDGANIRIYIDGQEDSASPVAYNSGIATNNYKVYIGANTEVTGRYWCGLLDDIRIYNYALNAHEVEHALCGGTSISDLNHDCVVDLADFAILTSAWLSEPPDPLWNPDCDISIPPDDAINAKDLALFVQDWLAGGQ